MQKNMNHFLIYIVNQDNNKDKYIKYIDYSAQDKLYVLYCIKSISIDCCNTV